MRWSPLRHLLRSAQALGLRPWLALLPLRERRLRARLLMGTPRVSDAGRATMSPDGAKGSTDHSCVSNIVAHLKCMG